MATLMVALAARDSLSEDQKEALRHVGEQVSLGDPAIMVDANGTEWAVYDDPRFRLEDACRGGRIMANAASFPDFQPTGKGRREIHAEDVRFAADQGVVLPDAIPGLQQAENPWQAALDANGAPASMKMAAGLPPGLSPKPAP